MKLSLEPEDIDRIAELMSAMAERRRLLILMCLGREELRVTDLQMLVGGSQATVSEHLGRLVKSGLVKGRTQGRSIYYAVADHRVQELVAICIQLAKAPAADGPEATAARSAPSILQLLRDHGDHITKSSALLSATVERAAARKGRRG
jgi:DNA-binding transcriptional ArsR family regulator